MCKDSSYKRTLSILVSFFETNLVKLDKVKPSLYSMIISRNPLIPTICNMKFMQQLQKEIETGIFVRSIVLLKFVFGHF